MKFRAIAGLALTLALAVGSASAQSIGVFFDADGQTCATTSQPNTPFNFWIIAQLGGATSGGITGAEFRVTGFPGSWFGNPNPNPSSNVSVGNPLQNGCNIAFPVCQPGSGGNVLLYTINGFATSAVMNHYMQVLQHTTPSNPNFLCPLVTICDAVFTKICVSGGIAIINGGPCTVGVEPATWTGVKGLFN